MHGWKQGDMFLADQESRDCYDFISDVGICGVYLSLALGTAKFKHKIDHVLSIFKKIIIKIIIFCFRTI